jgi:hypothetical protein
MLQTGILMQALWLSQSTISKHCYYFHLEIREYKDKIYADNKQPPQTN